MLYLPFETFCLVIFLALVHFPPPHFAVSRGSCDFYLFLPFQCIETGYSPECHLQSCDELQKSNLNSNSNIKPRCSRHGALLNKYARMTYPSFIYDEFPSPERRIEAQRRRRTFPATKAHSSRATHLSKRPPHGSPSIGSRGSVALQCARMP